MFTPEINEELFSCEYATNPVRIGRAGPSLLRPFKQVNARLILLNHTARPVSGHLDNSWSAIFTPEINEELFSGEYATN